MTLATPLAPPTAAASHHDVVVIGSANLDLVATTVRLPRPGETVLGTSYAEHAGGKGLNQAIAAARAGATVAMIGAVGDDEPGERLCSIATAEGVDMSAVARIGATPTGRAVITVDAGAENSIVVIPGANRHVVAGVPVPHLQGSVVLAQLEVPIAEVTTALRSARAAGARTILNPAPAQDLPDDLLAACDIVIPNEHELELIGGVDRLLERGVATVVVTRGAAGVRVTEQTAAGRRSWEQPAYPVTPIDTTGAGDAFCGALAACLARGAKLHEAVAFAAAAGALATTVAGAVPSLPDREQIEALGNRPVIDDGG